MTPIKKAATRDKYANIHGALVAAGAKWPMPLADIRRKFNFLGKDVRSTMRTLVSLGLARRPPETRGVYDLVLPVAAAAPAEAERPARRRMSGDEVREKLVELLGKTDDSDAIRTLCSAIERLAGGVCFTPSMLFENPPFAAAK